MPDEKTDLIHHQHPLGEERKYVKALAARFPGTMEFETGCGHIAHDLMARLPSIPEVEDAKALFCSTVATVVSPLAACLFAKSVCLRINTSLHTLMPPEVVAGFGTYSVFDIPADVMRHCILPPPDRDAYDSAFRIDAGVAVLCEPLDLAGHQFRDSTGDPMHKATDAVWDWTERMLRDWYDRAGKPFVAERLRIRTTGLVGQILGVVETAAVEAIAAGAGVSANMLYGHRSETPHHITRAFIHEAGYAETAAHPKTKEPETKESKTKEPAPTDAHEHQHPHPARPHPDVS
jgi:hypothetical protein